MKLPTICTAGLGTLPSMECFNGIQLVIKKNTAEISHSSIKTAYHPLQQTAQYSHVSHSTKWVEKWEDNY